MQGESIRTGEFNNKDSGRRDMDGQFFYWKRGSFRPCTLSVNFYYYYVKPSRDTAERHEAAGQRIKMRHCFDTKRSLANIGPNYYLDIH